MTKRKKSRKNGVASDSSVSEKDKKNKIYCVITGICTGIVNGLFGGGGGMLVVPLLIYLLKYPPKNAHATAILIILPMSILSGIIYASFGNVRPDVLLAVGGGVIGGGIIGALLLSKFSSNVLIIIFSVVMAAAGVKMLFF